MPPKGLSCCPLLVSILAKNSVKHFSNCEAAAIEQAELGQNPRLGIRRLGCEGPLGQLSLYLDFVPNKELLLKLAQQGLMFLNSFKFDNKDIWAGRY